MFKATFLVKFISRGTSDCTRNHMGIKVRQNLHGQFMGIQPLIFLLNSIIVEDSFILSGTISHQLFLLVLKKQWILFHNERFLLALYKILWGV